MSGFSALEEGGLKALLELVRKELRAQNAGMVVLDGFAAVGETAASDREFKKFVHELQVHASLSACTFFLLSSGLSDPRTVQPVHTMVDGLVRLSDHAFGVRAQRELQVQKFRGSRYLRGVHSFDISDDGIRVQPRLESFSADLLDVSSDEKLSTGVEHLDEMLGGGLRVGTTTMLVGPTGVGKTTLGYCFLGRSRKSEKGVLFSFYESPKAALAKARSVGVDLMARCESNELEMAWHSPVETALDVIGGRLLEAVDRTKAKRVFVDGFNALQSSATYPERVEQFFGALSRELHTRGVTALYSAEVRDIFAPQIRAPADGISPLLENLLLMRFVEHRGSLRRVISVLKTRDSGFDPRIRDFTIGARGIEIGSGFDHVEAVMTGVAHEARRAPASEKRPSKKKAGRVRRRSR